MKYTYSDDEDFLTDSTSARRSHRNTRHHSPTEPSGPVVTASGRQIRRPDRMHVDASNAETRSVSGSVRNEDDDAQSAAGPRGRPQRSAAANHGMNGWTSTRRKSEEYDSDSDDDGSEPEYGGDDEDDHVPDESVEDEEEFKYEDVDDEEYDDSPSPALVVKLRAKVDVNTETGKVFLVGKPEGIGAKLSTGSPPATKSEDLSGSTVQSSSPPRSSPAEETADVISVAIKQRTPEPALPIFQPLPQAAPPQSGTGTGQAVTAALAFRGSPEKPQHISPQLDVGYVE
jgi:hypothetical protein